MQTLKPGNYGAASSGYWADALRSGLAC
jgi:hypothetical protein